METKLVLAYAVGMEFVHRTLEESQRRAALDIACGPGHYTLCLAKYLKFESVLGGDLSAPMVEIAQKNAQQQRLADRVRFQQLDATCLEGIGEQSVDLSSFTDAAHHMPDLDHVTRVLTAMHRVTRAAGVVMLMDLVRLKTAALTERYVNTLGADYVRMGLPSFLDDFRNSMYAAWTERELASTVPTDTGRQWWHVVPRGLPTIQILLGLPAERPRPLIGKGLPWNRDSHPVPSSCRTEWRLARWSVLNGRWTRLG